MPIRSRSRRRSACAPRLDKVLGKEHPYELEWVSVYTFNAAGSTASCMAA